MMSDARRALRTLHVFRKASRAALFLMSLEECRRTCRQLRPLVSPTTQRYVLVISWLALHFLLPADFCRIRGVSF